MSTKRRFECTITKYSLEYTVDDIRKCALLENINTDFIYMKALISLIKQSVVTLQEHGIKLIRQFIHCDEWNKYLVNKNYKNAEACQVLGGILVKKLKQKLKLCNPIVVNLK